MNPSEPPTLDALFIEAKARQYMYLYDFVIQLALLKHGVRRAYLLETSNIHTERPRELLEQITSQLLSILAGHKLHVQKMPDSVPEYPRYLVSTEPIQLANVANMDSVLGQYLGFSCQMCDTTTSDIGIHAVSMKSTPYANIITEICDMNNADANHSASNKWRRFVERANSILNQYNVTLIYEYKESDSMQTRITNISLKQYPYVRNNMDEYINDLANCLNPDEDTSGLSGIFTDINLDAFRLLYLRYVPIDIHEPGITIQDVKKWYTVSKQWIEG